MFDLLRFFNFEEVEKYWSNRSSLVLTDDEPSHFADEIPATMNWSCDQNARHMSSQKSTL